MDEGGNGNSNKEHLKKVVDKLKDFSTATKPVGTFDITGPFNNVAKALQHLIGYDESGSRKPTGKGMGRKGPPNYTSSYSKEAQWQSNWDAESQVAKKAANIFLGSMPMVYYIVTYLYFKCTVGRDGWSTAQLNTGQSGLNNFMLQMEFNTGQLSGLSRSAIAKLLTNEYNGFDGRLSKFFHKLEEKHGKDKLATNATSYPLYSLQLAAKAYLKTTVKSDSDEESDPNLKETKNKLKSSKVACNSEQHLEDGFDKFLTDIHLPTSNSSHSSGTSDENFSSAGPVAGTLSTLGLGGGAAAAYIFNIGGAKTLVNGLLRIG
ncbi:variant erythrocyte surface antigen-1 family protein [Babesia caballi]|uniref:Variant erythrocyte surface antigen-1 family protein n=1 Tax=Babesia caballi TaxID=5871 RepID=A0AAV4M0S8_BABCB|nr:variant erythrocyte surface antigen-1 family protein [Babesia caballi]